MGPKKRRGSAETEIGPSEELEPAGTEMEPIPETIPETAPETIPETKAAASVVAKPRPVQPLGDLTEGARVELRVYLASCGDKPDQVAGFARWVRKQDLGAKTIPAWRELRAEFNQRPV